MSLNWKEINLILEELDLQCAQIQKAIQSAYDVIFLKIYGRSGAKTLLISLSPLSCRLHEAFDSAPKSDKPMRFAEFLNSRIVNSRIEEAIQLEDNRIVRLTVRRSFYKRDEHYRIYLRLWSNAANVIVTDMDGKVLDAMRRLPKRHEVSGGFYTPETANLQKAKKPGKEYFVRDFSEEILAGLPPDASFNQKINAFYREKGGSLSLESLREEAKQKYEGSIDRLKAAIEKLKEKEGDFSGAERFKEYADIIFANINRVKTGDEWLETENFDGETVRIKLNARRGPAVSAEDYYEQYRKAKSGLSEVKSQIEEGRKELIHLQETLDSLLAEKNPLVLNKLLKGRQVSPYGKPLARSEDAKRPGLSFRRNKWLIIVGRDAAENDALLRKHVKGNDLWLHARDYPGSYVFIKHQAGKTVPLDILLDAGNLAIFYSKGRNAGEGDLFYTPVKYLRRVRNGPRGLVIPTQEKNLHVKVETARLKELEDCRV